MAKPLPDIAELLRLEDAALTALSNSGEPWDYSNVCAHIAQELGLDSWGSIDAALAAHYDAINGINEQET